jgi:glutathione-regulated potassium-efflux system ancillary protein KefG
MAKVLVLFAHPALEKSRVHSRLVRHIRHLQDVTFHDLYQHYPEFDIDVKREQQLLLRHDIIVWQHPFYWYSSPPLLKQWQDLVLEHGWAYGSGGNKLADKWIFNAITCGAARQVYCQEGRNRFTIPQLLAPFDQTATLCKMHYLPPFVVDGTHKLSQGDIELFAVQYEQLLVALANDRISMKEWKAVEFLNKLNPIPQIIQS